MTPTDIDVTSIPGRMSTVEQPGEPGPSSPPSTVEFRIHGIGNHSPWSALGRPRRAGEGAYGGQSAAAVDASEVHSPALLANDGFVNSFSAPVVDEPLWLLNWARTSRRIASFAWFLAIPMTMVNVAGHMRSPERDDGGRLPRGTVAASVHLAAVLVTVAVLTWVIVLAETVLKHMGGWGPLTIGPSSTAALRPSAASV